MITAEEYNERVRAAMRNQRLGGTVRLGSGGDVWHHWMTTGSRQTDLLWRVQVGPGTVNDRMAAIPYLRTGDPRGWVLPPDRIVPPTGPVDRLLTELADPPCLLATVPSPSSSSSSSGDFRPVPDADRTPLQFFRSAEMWDRELYSASVFITATPGRYSLAEDRYHFPVTAQPTRFRIGLASRLPTVPTPNPFGGVRELARLYLTRSNGDPSTDQLYVQQRCFWSLWTLNVAPQLAGTPSLFSAPTFFGGIGLGFVDGFAAGVAAVTDALVDEVLVAIADLLRGASSQPFWTAV